MWNSNLITFNQARKELDLPKTQEGEKYKAEWDGEMQQQFQQSPFDSFGGGGGYEFTPQQNFSQEADTGEPPLPTNPLDNGNPMHEKFVEGRTYIKNPNEAPKGANIRKGPRGGLY